MKNDWKERLEPVEEVLQEKTDEYVALLEEREAELVEELRSARQALEFWRGPVKF